MTNHAESLLVTLADGIKRITINRPERRNSVDLDKVRSQGDDFVLTKFLNADAAVCLSLTVAWDIDHDSPLV